MALNNADFSFIAGLARQHFGNVLDPQKDYFVESRLRTLAQREGHGSLKELLEKARESSSAALQRRLAEALLNNETSFFRDARPFETLRSMVIPELMTRYASERSFNIWSSACSSGQEPYSIAMTLR